MKNKFVLLLCGLLLAMGQSALAQTPDGQTPAEETVCEPLRADDGITKGLYGLCVAFCEAQDYADPLVPMSEEEYAALEIGKASGAILAAYNRKRDNADNGIDPPMPCVVQEDQGACPCWTEGLAAATPPNSNYDVSFPNSCYEIPSFLTLIENWEYTLPSFQIYTLGSACALNSNNFPGLTSKSIYGLTDTEAEACRQSIRDHANSNGNAIPGERWDCFSLE